MSGPLKSPRVPLTYENSMGDHELVWDPEAIRDYEKLLRRRKDVARVRRCVEQHLLAVAENPSLAERFPVSEGIILYRFECSDGRVQLYLQAELYIFSPTLVAVLHLGTIRF